jgi:tRNA threonylcarbamoyladenosine biosynthesis protein TsaB
MSLSLIIDSSFDFTVGIVDIDSADVIDYKKSDSNMDHIENILPSVKSLLDKNNFTVDDIKEVKVGIGPGAFTGLRAGIAAGIGLARGLGAKVSGFETLKACAESAFESAAGKDEVLIINDARRKLVYWGHYLKADKPDKDGAFYKQLAIDISPISDLESLLQKSEIYIAGNITQNPVNPKKFVRAAFLQNPTGLEPLYLRKPDIG